MALPKERRLNQALSAALGRDVVKFEVLPLAVGDVQMLSFERVTSDWRQGLWLATEGQLEVAGQRSSQLLLWADTTPERVEISCHETDGLLRLYNVWHSGRRPGHESQSHTSGMLVEALQSGGNRYRCNDIGLEPNFSKLVFTLCPAPN